ARHGADVALTYRRHGEMAEEVAAQIEALGRRARALELDVLDEEGTIAALRALEAEWGPLDILVNNAGITQNLPLPLLEADDFSHVMDVNVKGSYLTARAALRSMIRRKAGVILNLGSLAGERMLEAPIHYCASKAAIAGMTRAMAKEVARHRIRVLCLAPGLLEEGVGRNIPESRREDYLRHCALGRLGTLEEVAETAAFLVSDQNSFMSGEVLVMDGGV
ncbi:MAG: SDR family oxidoreductase, partial [Myxococcales bacterium]|nr:SDR family oxidoreductase [Myxococcales bacterium]